MLEWGFLLGGNLEFYYTLYFSLLCIFSKGDKKN
jgi:hypothetical protein